MTSHMRRIVGIAVLAAGSSAGCGTDLATPPMNGSPPTNTPDPALEERADRLIDVPEVRLAQHLSQFVGTTVRPRDLRFPRMRQLYSWYAAPDFMINAAGTGGTFLYAQINDTAFQASTLMFNVPVSARPFYAGAKFVVMVNEAWNPESGWRPGKFCDTGEECRAFPVLTREILDFVPEIYPDPHYPYAYLHCSPLLCLAKLSSEPKADECDPFLNPCPPFAMGDIQAEYVKIQSIGATQVETRVAVQLDGAHGFPVDSGGSIADDIGG